MPLPFILKVGDNCHWELTILECILWFKVVIKKFIILIGLIVTLLGLPKSEYPGM